MVKAPVPTIFARQLQLSIMAAGVPVVVVVVVVVVVGVEFFVVPGKPSVVDIPGGVGGCGDDCGTGLVPIVMTE